MVFFVMRTILANKVYKVKFALGRFGVSIVLVYMLAIVASFMNVNPKFVCLSIGLSIIISILYRDVLCDCFTFMKQGIIMGKRR